MFPILQASPFPNFGVSLDFLRSIRDDPRMKEPMVHLARPELSAEDIEKLGDDALRALAKELRVYSHKDGKTEFSKYDDRTIPRAEWHAAIHQPPTTTTHVNICIVKPTTKGTGGSYATLLRGDGTLVGAPTDFASHAWRYNFSAFVDAIEAEAKRAAINESSATSGRRYYWNDIFVENQVRYEYFFYLVTIGKVFICQRVNGRLCATQARLQPASS